MANETIVRFGYPDSVVREYEGWVVLLRHDQITLGSLVLAVKSGARALSEVEPARLAELAAIGADIERGLGAAFAPDRLNYLMLMMVDPHVHFHVIPRYAEPRDLDGVSFADGAWPRPPAMLEPLEMSGAQREAVLARLRAAWPG